MYCSAFARTPLFWKSGRSKRVHGRLIPRSFGWIAWTARSSPWLTSDAGLATTRLPEESRPPSAAETNKQKLYCAQRFAASMVTYVRRRRSSGVTGCRRPVERSCRRSSRASAVSVSPEMRPTVGRNRQSGRSSVRARQNHMKRAARCAPTFVFSADARTNGRRSPAIS
jgi:hypothetical protein